MVELMSLSYIQRGSLDFKIENEVLAIVRVRKSPDRIRSDRVTI